MNKLLRWADSDYSLAYIYARGYFDGRTNDSIDTPLDWMTPEEVGIYGTGYNKGIDDFEKLEGAE